MTRPARGLWLRCAAPTTARPEPVAGRVIAGELIPWGVSGRPTGYPGLVRFERGSVDLSSLAGAPLLLDHDPARPIGRVTGMIDAPDGLSVAYYLGATPAGDAALTLVAEGIRTGLSVGALVDRFELGDEDADGVPELLVTGARARESSLLTFPAYPSARAAPLTPNPEGIPDA